jgi:hypothetical protein
LSDRHIKPFVRDANFSSSSSSIVYPLPFILFHPTAFCITYSAPARQLTVMVRVKFPTPAGCFFTVWHMTSLGWGVLGVVPCLPHTVPLAWPASYLLYTFPIAVGIAARVRIALSTWEGSEISPASMSVNSNTHYGWVDGGSIDRFGRTGEDKGTAAVTQQLNKTSRVGDLSDL